MATALLRSNPIHGAGLGAAQCRPIDRRPTAQNCSTESDLHSSFMSKTGQFAAAARC
jgi:hypothetical protein